MNIFKNLKIMIFKKLIKLLEDRDEYIQEFNDYNILNNI